MGDLHAVMLGGPGYRDAFLDVVVDRDEQIPPYWLLMRAHLFIHSRSRSRLCVRMTVWIATIRKKRRPVQHQPDIRVTLIRAVKQLCGSYLFFRGCLIVLSASGCSVAQMHGAVKTNKESFIANDCSWWPGNRKRRGGCKVLEKMCAVFMKLGDDRELQLNECFLELTKVASKACGYP